ncbi:MAG: amidohydrolase [Candidatus Saliniplasma sp.]
MSKGFINCNVISLAGRSEKYHGFLVEDGKITCTEDYDKIMTQSEEKVNLQGCTVLPGFIDSHVHLMQMGLKMDWVDLSDTESFEEASYYLEKEVRSKDQGEWIIGVDFDDTKWKKSSYPSKQDLDDVSEEHPIILKRICGHIGVANSRALDMIDGDWGKVDRDTGILKEEAVWNLDEVIDIDMERRKEAIKRGIKNAHELGVTGIHEIVDRDGWEAYAELDDEMDLALRVRCYLHYDEVGDLEPTNKSEYLSLRGVKIFADGSLGGRTAALKEEYTDDPGNTGMLMHPKEELNEIISMAESRGFQCMIHAIGDRAIDVVLDAYADTAERTKELRHRIEHAEMLWDENIKRIRELELVLSIQPNFAYKWSQPGGMNEKRLGKERLEKCDPLWNIQRALVKMAFGSDNMPMSPLFGIYAATNHPLLDQRISTYNALQSYITNSAYIGRDESKMGELTEGKKADFVVLSENPLNAENIKDIEVKMTVVNGKIVYDNR